MTDELRETHGPDRCRSNINCRDFHDAPVQITGRRMHCCCCNTCLSLRPGVHGDETRFRHCCRCVPRLIYLQFTPYDGGDECCASVSIPITYGGTDEDDVTTYSGVIVGVTVTVTVGASQAAYDEYDEYEDRTCVWRVVAVKEGVTLVDDEYEIDHEVVSCLDVSAITITDVEGPNGCEGTLSLANMQTARLPFVENEDSRNGEIIELYPPCGDCTQVCSKLCLYGNRMPGYGREFVEFGWFDNGVDDRGWMYTGPSETEIIYLETSEYGECQLRFEWTDSDVLEDRVIDLDNGCACGMKEVVTYHWHAAGTIGFTIRCGRCSCWDFYCGTCRCVPQYLCVMAYIDNVFTDRMIVSWDEDERCWIAGQGVGYEDSRELRICLEADEDTGECILVATVDGEEIGTPVSRTCGDERIERKYDASTDFISGTWEGYIGYNEDEYAWVLASSQLDDCRIGPCSDATPCVDECGSHPETLTALFTGWNDPYDDETGFTGSCAIEVQLHYWELLTWAGSSLDVTCGYIGFAYLGDCYHFFHGDQPKWVRVELSGGQISMWYRWSPGTSWVNCDYLQLVELTEECDPYSGESGDITGFLQTCCFSCDTTVQRYTVTVTS